ncbi:MULTISPECIES: lasso peptide biosynthesis PqqD family chaperone [Actinomadura]|uniref:Lasso peptide biosynthesis PqqD family chaperone n=1 Tax=Actinomadura yumaensis TaxID=111807 RepID=A0ABW2CK25_9ACTN|nr:lasso peptide biosynthesis PqqD family chaperone [Actinomadura sp. J1-007]MWK37826.1 lasso peptide biosynthesis PqqD family chaperone [Actinomadura sp. J1-007]
MKLSPDVSATDADTGMVLLDERTGRYWTLNQTGSDVVRLLLAGCTAEEAADELAARHPSFADRIADDVEALIASLVEARVILP